MGRGERAPTRVAPTEYGMGVGTADVGAGLVPAQVSALDRADTLDRSDTIDECAQRRPQRICDGSGKGWIDTEVCRCRLKYVGR